MADPSRSLAFAIENYPEKVEVLPIEELVLDSARQNPKRPAYLKLAVPDEVVKAVKGPAERRKDLLLLVSVPKDILEREESRIILPTESR